MTKNPERSIKIKNETGKSNRNCPFRMNVHNDTLPNKKSEYPYGYSDCVKTSAMIKNHCGALLSTLYTRL